MMYRENLENKINKPRLFEEVKEFGQIGIQSLLDHEMTDTSPIEDMSYLQCQMHFDESIESIAADSDLEDGETKKVADFTTVCPKSFRETGCNGHSGKRGKCTNGSSITGSDSFREAGCIVFTKT